MSGKKKEAVRLTTPVGRLLNSSLWEKDQYENEKGKKADPAYKVEIAFEDNDELAAFENALVAAAVDKWGEDAEADYDNGVIQSPLKDGDEYAKKRERKNKIGDAYKGKVYIRAKSIFNRNGEDAPGGVYVCDENAQEIDFADRGKVYNGCYVLASVTVNLYDIDDERGVSLYLNGIQFVKDGERLRGTDPSSLFSPMMGVGSEAKGRRRRGS